MFLIYAGVFMTMIIALLVYPFWVKKNDHFITGIKASDDEEKKSGLLHKIFGIFGGKKPDQDAPKENNPDSQQH